MIFYIEIIWVIFRRNTLIIGGQMENNFEGSLDMGQAVRCDYCGCAFVPECLSERDGEIEYTFFRCDYCGKAYVVSVTDAALRRDIARYAAIARRNRIKCLSEKALRDAAKLKENNIRRQAELRQMYLLED